MELFRRILPLTVAAAFSPTCLVVASLIAGTQNGRRKLVAYIAGWALAALALGVAFASLTGLPGAGGSKEVDAWVDVILGVMIAVVGVVSYLLRDRINKRPKEPKKQKAGRGEARYVSVGAAIMFTNVSSMVPLAAAAREIAKSNVSAPDRLAAAVFLLFMTTLPALIPLGILITAGDRAQALLNRGAQLAEEYGPQLCAALFVVVGAWLATRGGIVLGWW